FRIAISSIGDLRPVFTTREGLEVPLPGRGQLRMLGNAVAAVLALLIGLFAASSWDVWLAWRNAVPFGQADPILGHDVGFYVFSLPFLQLVLGLAQTLVVLAALAAGGLYLVTGGLSSGFPARFRMRP